VLNERLGKLVRFGVLAKSSYPEIPPRVEYDLTEFGNRIAQILDEVHKLRREMGQA
jgi:DNA-binding HxlR family transcriptional regulator